MSFWDEHEKAEAAHEEAERAKLPPSAQNAPTECTGCGRWGVDVLFGTCTGCYKDWEESQ